MRTFLLAAAFGVALGVASASFAADGGDPPKQGKPSKGGRDGKVGPEGRLAKLHCGACGYETLHWYDDKTKQWCCGPCGFCH